jgi:hypothetical protein
MMRTRIYNIGESVSVQVAPHHCHLIHWNESLAILISSFR